MTDQNYVITPEAVETAGCVTYWRVSGDVSIEAFTKAWKAAGLDEKLLRAEPEPTAALRRAVLELTDRTQIGEDKEIRTLVRPQKEPHTWAIVTEIIVKGSAPSYATRVIVSYDNGPHITAVEAGEVEVQNLRARILDAFTRQAGSYATNDVTGWLVRLAYKHGAITLRDSGGVYFIPRPAMEFWTKAADVLEAVTGKAHQVFRIPAMKNAEAVAAIVDAVTAEAEQIAQKIEEEINAGQLGSRAYESRKESILALLDKVAAYEELVGTQIKVRERMETLQSAVAQAALLASAEPTAEAAA